MRTRTLGSSVWILAAFAVAGDAARAEPLIGGTRNSFGMPGLVDMPTAEVAPDATLGGTYFHSEHANRTSLTFQIAPRLTGAFRYSRVDGLDPDRGALYDRSFDLHYQFLDEGEWTPAMAVGLRDFIGTGIYSGEYLVATKTLAPGLRATAGLGWGRLGSHGDIGSPFGERPPLDFGQGGKANTDQWFRGPVAPFLGVSWQVNDRLTLMAEYSSDAYAAEVDAGVFERKSSVNLGLDYEIARGARLGAYYLHGSEAGLTLSFALNPKTAPAPSGLEGAPLPVRPRPSRAADPEAWTTDWATDPAVGRGIRGAVAEALEKDGMILESLALSATAAELRLRNTRYGAHPEAIGRAARILTRALPPSVETITVTPVAEGMALSSVTIRRSDLEALEHHAAAEMLARAAIGEAGPTRARAEPDPYPRFLWSLHPYIEASLFDPSAPVRGDVGLEIAGRYELAPGLVLSGAARKKVAGNMDKTDRSSDSVLPHVRSDLAEYEREGDPSIEHLTLAWYARPGPNLYSRLTAGYLEKMYGGVSAELLWKPVDSRLALGAEVNYARQRDFDQLFGFRDYDIVTGHASVYYSFGNGFIGQLDMGRYLAGDWGATVALDREFANGWRVGAYATLTDVSAEDFGEGSFDKGIRLTVPLDWVTGQPSRNRVSATIRPLTRDGGARLHVGGRLYDTVREGHEEGLEDDWGRFWR